MSSLETCAKAARGEACCLLEHADVRSNFSQNRGADSIIVESPDQPSEIVPIFDISLFRPPYEASKFWLTYVNRNPRLVALHSDIDQLPESSGTRLLAALNDTESIRTEKFTDCGLQKIDQNFIDSSTPVLTEVA